MNMKLVCLAAATVAVGLVGQSSLASASNKNQQTTAKAPPPRNNPVNRGPVNRGAPNGAAGQQNRSGFVPQQGSIFGGPRPGGFSGQVQNHPNPFIANTHGSTPPFSRSPGSNPFGDHRGPGPGPNNSHPNPFTDGRSEIGNRPSPIEHRPEAPRPPLPGADRPYQASVRHLSGSPGGHVPQFRGSPGRFGGRLRPLPSREERRQVWSQEIARERSCAGPRHFGRAGPPTCFVGFSMGFVLPPEENADLVVYSGQLLAEPGAVEDTWTGDDGQSVELTTSDPEPQQQEVTFATDEAVEAPPEGVKVDPATYVVVTRTLNFRSSPTTADANIIGYFSKDEDVEVMGRTPDGKWALVGDNGVVVGYAAFEQNGHDLMKTPADAAEAEQKRARAKLFDQPRSDRQVASASRRTEQNLNDSSHIRVADVEKIKTTKVVASTECKSIIASHGSVSDQKTGCAQPDGGWAIG